MNLVDSSGWIEVFVGGTNADHFQRVIKDTKNLIVPTIVIYEVFRKLLVEKSEGEALEHIGVLLKSRQVELNAELALQAAKISVDQKLGMADSIIFATAQKYNATIWTQDADFKGLPGVKYFAKK